MLQKPNPFSFSWYLLSSILRLRVEHSVVATLYRPVYIWICSQQEESTPGSIYLQPALVRPGDASAWDSSPWVQYYPDYVNRNNTQYLVDNNDHNDSQTVPRASFGSAIHTANTTPLVAPFTQEPNLQEPLEPEAIGNGINSDENSDVHRQEREQK